MRTRPKGLTNLSFTYTRYLFHHNHFVLHAIAFCQVLVTDRSYSAKF